MTPDFPRPGPGTGPERAAGYADWGMTRSAAWRFTLPVRPGGLSHSAHGRIYDAAWNSPYWYHYPSLNVNAGGDLLVGFSGSGAIEHIGAFYRARRANGTWMARPGLVQAGRGAWGSDRWGTTRPPARILRMVRFGRFKHMPIQRPLAIFGALGLRESRFPDLIGSY